MASHDYDYPEDEFDVLGSNRTPQAVHRAPRPWWHVWGPLIAVVIIAPLLAYGLVAIATRDGSPTPGATSSQEVTDGTGESPAEGEGATTEEPAPEESAPVEEETTEEPPPPPLDQSITVRVLNGASVQGLAGRVGETVTAAGWTSVEPGNYQSAQPEISTVFYETAEMADEAAALGELLGITNVVELPDSPNLTVVLRPDFSE